MKLVLGIPSDWETSSRGELEVAAVPGSTAEPDLILTVSRLRPLPPVVDGGWIERQLSSDVPDAVRLSILESADDKSTDGWPVTRFRIALLDEADVLVEQRLSVFFRILDQFAIVELRGTDRDRWNDLAGELGSIAMGASLDWTTAPCSLAQIYNLDPDDEIFTKTGKPAS